MAAYVPAVRSGNHVYTSGQLPFVDGALAATGKVGAEVDRRGRLGARAGLRAQRARRGQVAARRTSTITRVVKVVGFVASAPDFTGQPAVVNGASELLGAVFGDAGQARPQRGRCRRRCRWTRRSRSR